MVTSPIPIPRNADQQTQLAFQQAALAIQSLSSDIAKMRGTATQLAATSNSSTAAIQAAISLLQQQLATVEAEIAAIESQLGLAYTAQEDILTYCAVYQSSVGYVSIANSDDAATMTGVLGIAAPVASSGQAVSVYRWGTTVSVPAWSWTAQAPIFVGPSGTLTQTPPTTGVLLLIAWAVDTNSAIVFPSEPIYLDDAGSATTIAAITPAGELGVVQLVDGANTHVVQTGNEIRIDADTSSGIWAPMATGAVPVELLSTVDGQCIMTRIA